MYDLLIKGGTVIDPSRGINGPNDVAVDKGLIARVAPAIAAEEARRVVEVRGKVVTPGLIDVHTHVYDGVTGSGVQADLGGVRAGVTTMADAGSAGCDTFGGFPSHIIPNNHTEIICFLHICRTGLATRPDIFSPDSIDLDNTVRVVSENRDIITGIKARMVSPALEIMGMEMPRLAKRAAQEAGVKLMVHIGDTEHRYDPNVIRQLLPIMEEGDIVTHLFTANPGGVIDAQGKAGARGPGGTGTRRLAGHGPRPVQLQLRHRGARPRPGAGSPLHQHRLDPARPDANGPQHDRNDEPVPGPRLHHGPGCGYVDPEPGQGPGSGRPPGQPGSGQAGRHLGSWK